MNSCHCCIWKRFLLRTNELPSCSHKHLHLLLFVQISDAAVAKTRLCKNLISEFLTLQGFSDNHWRHSWFWMSITFQFCGGHSQSKWLSHHLLSRGSSASDDRGSHKLSYRGTPCHGPLDGREAVYSWDTHPTVLAQCSTAELPLRQPSVKTSCI